VKKLALLILLLPSLALATTNEFFLSLRAHPTAKAAALLLEASQQEATNAANRLSLDASGGFLTRSLWPADPCPLLDDPDPSNDVFCPYLTATVPTKAAQAEVGVTFRAIAYGDIADHQQTAQLNYRTALIDYRSRIASLEESALETALQFSLAQKANDLAGKGVEVAAAALQATKIRHQKGAASNHDLLEAQLALERASTELDNAASSLELAEMSLRSFTTADPPSWPWPRLLPPADAEPPSVTKARLRLEQARVGLTHQQRAFFPVGEIRYQHNFNDNSALGISLETRTLGTRLYYSYQGPADPTRHRTKDEVRLGLRLQVDQTGWGSLEAARSRLQAATAALAASKKQSEIELARLQLHIEQNERRLALAKSSLKLAYNNYQDAQRRVELGLAVPLEAQQAWLKYSQAQLDLLKCQQDLTRSQIAVLVYLGVPPSEVWK